jgi:uncharacterized protein (TIGR03086 family)
MDSPTIDPLEAYGRILAWTARVISGTTSAQLSLPTPCTEWDVDALMQHIFGTVMYYTLLAEHADFAQQEISVLAPDGGDFSETYRSLSRRALDAWSQPGVLESPCDHAILGSVRGSYALSVHAADNLVHGWDLAVSTGQDDTMDPACAGFALETFEFALSREGSRRRHFASPIPVDQGTDVQARLLSFCGRALPIPRRSSTAGSVPVDRYQTPI